MNRTIFIRWFVIGILTGFTIYRCFVSIGNDPIQVWDEQTNIAVITDSLSSGSAPILTLHGQPFFEKPPLWYLTNAFLGSIVGVTPLTMRSISALSGLCMILLTAYLSFIWWGKLAGITTWVTILTTQQLFVTNPANLFATHTIRSADVDSLYLLFLMAAFAACIYMKRNSRFAVPAGICTGLAVLTKSPFGFAPLLIASVYLFRKNRAPLRLLCAWGTALVVTIPWHIYMTIRFGLPFISSYFLYHMGLRTVSPLEGHNNPFWYYESVIAHPAVFPGFIFLISSLTLLIYQKKHITDIRLRMSIILMLVCLILPTIMQTRLAWYILPFYPFAALVIGAGAHAVLRERGKPRGKPDRMESNEP